MKKRERERETEGGREGRTGRERERLIVFVGQALGLIFFFTRFKKP